MKKLLIILLAILIAPSANAGLTTSLVAGAVSGAAVASMMTPDKKSPSTYQEIQVVEPGRYIVTCPLDASGKCWAIHPAQARNVKPEVFVVIFGYKKIYKQTLVKCASGTYGYCLLIEAGY